jgi:hypothetical protein
VPFESRRRGQPCCVAMLMCNLKTTPDDPRYRTYQNSISRLPELSGYMAGRTFEARGEKPDRNWMEARIFAADAARRAAGGELIAVDESLMDAPRIYYFEGEVQI